MSQSITVSAEMCADLEGLSQAVSAGPGDWQLRRVYADALEDAGDTKAAERQRRVADAIESPGRVRLSARAETEIRRHARESRCPVRVVAGDSPPRAAGERGYSEFKGGGVCRYPGAAMRAGYKVRYVQSTREVCVGVLWLIAQGYVR